jgi:hypothetical protein
VRPPLQDAERAARAAVTAANDAAAAATKATSGKTSRHRGVSWRPDVCKWEAKVRHIHLGYFADQDDAGREVDQWTRDNFMKGDPLRKLNFDSDGTSKVNIGTFATQEGAAEAYDAMALELGRPTNFNQYGECNPEVKGKVVPQHDKWDDRDDGRPPRPRGGG